MSDPVWGADTIISMPMPLKKNQPALIDMGGFAFTEGGIAHNITASDVEVYISPPFRPQPPGAM